MWRIITQLNLRRPQPRPITKSFYQGWSLRAIIEHTKQMPLLRVIIKKHHLGPLWRVISIPLLKPEVDLVLVTFVKYWNCFSKLAFMHRTKLWDLEFKIKSSRWPLQRLVKNVSIPKPSSRWWFYNVENKWWSENVHCVEIQSILNWQN